MIYCWIESHPLNWVFPVIYCLIGLHPVHLVISHWIKLHPVNFVFLMVSCWIQSRGQALEFSVKSGLPGGRENVAVQTRAKYSNLLSVDLVYHPHNWPYNTSKNLEIHLSTPRNACPQNPCINPCPILFWSWWYSAHLCDWPRNQAALGNLWSVQSSHQSW